MQDKTDFSTGSVWKRILEMSVPLTAAQFINLLYNIVDRIYIARIPETGTLALTGVGLCFPIILLITGFSRLFGTGGSPLCSIELGKNNRDEAEHIMQTSFVLLTGAAVLIIAAGYIFMKPFLMTFGASEATYGFASDYLSIYLLGTVFVMYNTGINCYITCQGYAKTGMMTVVIGAVMNIILDPVFIFVLGLGVRGAAIATVISQGVSSVWMLVFLTGKKTQIRLQFSSFRFSFKTAFRIMSLGFSSFIMSCTSSLVQLVCNTCLSQYGGDIYISAMTILMSVRELCCVPSQGVSDGTIPVISYNYGQKNFKRVKSSIRFMSVSMIVYMFAAWLLLILFPRFFISIFSNDPVLTEITVQSLKIYFFGFGFMALQFAGQTVFLAMNKPVRAIIFSLLRKAVIVVPLTLILPHFVEPAVNGVFLAEPVSNFIGATACFVTMLCTIFAEL
ncbi:MAG: MATE family efflux transporter [Treponema sp.]|nr:MATE family efflux transporter [Candidatus Treponema caballi]